MKPGETENLIACLTPPGKGAVATVAVQGPNAWTAFEELFRPMSGKPVACPTAASMLIGKLGSGDGADDVVVAVKSLVPSPNLEIHCHGGAEVVRYLIELFQARGFRVVDWRTFVSASHGFVERLAHAPTLRTASILLDQTQGAYERLLARMKSETENRQQLGERFLSLQSLGNHLVEPWRVVIAGAPNVGKSSLVNAIAGYQRSVVSATAGTTRDVVAVTLAIDGWPVEMCDTAGLGDVADELDRAGMAQARLAMQEVELIVWVIAADEEEDWPTHIHAQTLRVVNKIDLAPRRKRDEGVPYVSAQTGEGIPEFLEMLSAALVPTVPLPGEAAPVNADQIRLVRDLMEATADEGG